MNRNAKLILLLVLGPLALLQATMAQHAAAGAYGFSSQSGFLTVTGGTFGGEGITELANVAGFGGFGVDSNTQPPGDPPQAWSGPRVPRPTQNDLSPVGKDGQYARSDSERSKAVSERFANVAEAYRTSPGSAAATALINLGYQIQQTSEDGITFTLRDAVHLLVATDASGESARARVRFVLELHDPETSALLFSWSPCGDVLHCFTRNDNMGVVRGVTDPKSLNTEINCPDGPCMKQYDADDTWTITYDREVGRKYSAILLAFEGVEVAVAAPPSLVIFGLGLAVIVLLGGVSRHSRASHPRSTPTRRAGMDAKAVRAEGNETRK